MNYSAYLRLARLDKPVGILLLWFPTAWALWAANQGTPPLNLLLWFFCGTVLMRSAGCVINDIIDRSFDKHVTRTRARPLTSGEVSLKEALAVLAVLLLGALLVLMKLNYASFYLACIAVLIVIVYPFCKRFFEAPQLILGLAFSMGMPMAYAASQIPMTWAFGLLCLINFLWIVAYDTMYAMTDKECDLTIGLKSTAVYFGRHDGLIVDFLLIMIHGLWLLWAFLEHLNPIFYGVWFMASGVLIHQHRLIYKGPDNCFKAFLVSVYYGCFMWFGIILGY